MTPQSVSDIFKAIISSIEIEIGQTVPLIRTAFVRVTSKAYAGVVALLYKYGSFIFLQLFVSSALARTTTISGRTLTPLIEWGRLVGAGDPLPGTAAELTIEIIVINQTGDPIPSGTAVVYEPTGVLYLTDANVSRDAPTKLVNIVAVSDQSGGGGIGAVGNIPIGALVSFTQPLADVLRDSLVTAIVTTGADGEDLETVYRQRVSDRFSKRIQGGALADYDVWARTVVDIIRSFPYTGVQPGTVEVYAEATVESSGNEDGFPTQSQLDAVSAAIDFNSNGRADRRPANAFVFVRSITRRSFTVEVIDLAAPDLPATKLAVEAGVATLFKLFEPFIGGLTVVPRDRVTKTEVGSIVDDIVKANNATFSDIILRAANTASTLFSALVSASGGDATQIGTAVTINDATLAFVSANTIGMHWTNVNVPFGSTITEAKLILTSKSVKAAYSRLTIVGEAAANSVVFTATTNNVSSRVPTISLVEWVPEAWVVDELNEIDITKIIAEIITVSGWAALNSLALIVTSAAGSDREAFSFDDEPTKSPRIQITFQDPTGLFVSQTVITLAIGEKARVTAVTFP